MQSTNKILNVWFTRRRLLLSDFEFDMQDWGAGSKFDQQSKKKLRDIVRHSCSSLPKSVLIALLARKLKARRILELGTCVGINALVLAALNPGTVVITIEGDRTLHVLARRLARITHADNLIFINAHFDKVLQQVLEQYNPDFVFIDGNHSFEPTVRYFEMICHLTSGNTTIVIDDISWSKDMRKAWKKIFCKRIDKKKTFIKFGLIFLNKNK